MKSYNIQILIILGIVVITILTISSFKSSIVPCTVKEGDVVQVKGGNLVGVADLVMGDCSVYVIFSVPESGWSVSGLTAFSLGSMNGRSYNRPIVTEKFRETSLIVITEQNNEQI